MPDPFDLSVREYMTLHDSTLDEAREAVEREAREKDREEMEKEMI